MGFFDKKYCDICGEKIGLLGNRKLADGNMCKKCAALLSPWVTDRRSQTLAEIKEHLAYREENKKKVADFNATRVMGNRTKVFIDEDKGQWLVCDSTKFVDANADVLDFSQVTGCSIDVRERKQEIYRLDEEQKQVSYFPPRHIYHYDFYIKITVNSNWFDEINFKVNDSETDGIGSADYDEAKRTAEEIKTVLTTGRENVRQTIAQANVPKKSITCPHCGATTIPDANGRCEFCGGSVNS